MSTQFSEEDKITEVIYDTEGEYMHGYIGYVIETERQSIKVLISNFQSCCEDFGIKMDKPSGIDNLVGLYVLSVKWGKEKKTNDDRCMDKVRNEAVVDIMTDKGLVQITAWNEHNGYYPHKVHVEWEGKNDTQKI